MSTLSILADISGTSFTPVVSFTPDVSGVSDLSDQPNPSDRSDDATPTSPRSVKKLQYIAATPPQ